mgnify:CR=1 FL=1
MQIAEKGLLTLVLDDGTHEHQAGLDLAEQRLRAAGRNVMRLALDIPAPQAICASLFLVKLYPVVLAVALGLGCNPDALPSLAKVTVTT